MRFNTITSSVMEAETIQKNGASPKSHTNRGNMRQRTFLFVFAFFVSVTSMYAQDVITLVNGETVKALVFEVGDVEVKFKKFENPQGPNYSLKKSNIFMILYANGSKDVFTRETEPATSTQVPATTTRPANATTTAPATAARQSNAQNRTVTSLEPLSLQGNKIYNSYGVNLSRNAIRNVMGDVPLALAQYNKGQRQRSAGWVFWGIEVGFCAIGLVTLFDGLANEDTDMVNAGYGCLLGSLVPAIPALILFSSGNRNIRNSVGTYNRGITQRNTSDLSLNFGITRSGGLGLTLNF